jgi:hypothetical protein
MPTFDLEITCRAPEAVTEHLSARDAAQAEATVRARADALCCVLATRRDGERYGDDFYVWLADDRALLRRDEHREWYAHDPARVSAAGETWFTDADGSLFPAQNGETVSRAQALDALSFWLRTGNLLPGLAWS